MIRTKKTHNNTFLFLTCLFTCLIIFLLVVIWKQCPSLESFHTEQISQIESTWYNTLNSDTVQTLPAVFPYDENGTAVMYTTLPESTPSYVTSLCFRASQNFVRIWVDGTLMYDTTRPSEWSPFFGKAPGSYWVILHLPDDFAGKELRIELTSPYKVYHGLLNPIFIGNKSSILFYITKTYGSDLLLGSVLLLLGTALFIFYWICVARKTSRQQMLYLAIFGMLTGFWFIGESRMLQFFTGHILFFYSLTIIALHLLPLPFFKITELLPDFPFSNLFRKVRYCVTVYFFLIILLQLFHILDFMEILNTSLSLLFLLCLFFLVLLYWDFLHNKNKQIFSMVLSGTILCIFTCCELLYGLINLQAPRKYYFKIGVFSFYLIICIFSIHQAFLIYMESRQAFYYKKLSYTDHMTGCFNRRAFTERVEKWNPENVDVILMADLNHLKYVNDNLGHYAGDSYIIACAESMQEVFKHRGDCYRLGGDEFLFWGNHVSQKQIYKLQEKFTALLEKKCSSISPLCCAATGIAISMPSDTSFEDILKRADAQMYENKRLMKKQLAAHQS